jgi:hypothetical protein
MTTSTGEAEDARELGGNSLGCVLVGSDTGARCALRECEREQNLPGFQLFAQEAGLVRTR